MASPYFTPVRVRPINTSGMSEAGRAIGNSYAQMGSVIGQAIGTIGNAYFEDKKLERTMMAYLGSEEGQQFLLEKGYAPNEIQDMISGVKPLRSEVKKLFKDMGGVEKVRQNVREKMEFDQRTQINQAKLKESEVSIQNLQMQNEEQKTQLEKEARRRRVLGHLFENNMSIQGYQYMQEDGDVLAEVGKEYKIPGLSQQTLIQYLDGLPKESDVYQAVREFNVKTGASTEQAQENHKYADLHFAPLDRNKYAEFSLEAVEQIEGILQKDDMVFPVTGFGGSFAKHIPGTSAFDVAQKLQTIEADLGFGRLQDMRDASQTGGALGQVSERELDLLKSSIVALNQSTSEEEFKKTLSRVKLHYTNTIKSIKAMNYARAQGVSFANTQDGKDRAMAFMEANGVGIDDNETPGTKNVSDDRAKNYVFQKLKKGTSREQVINNLVNAGNSPEEAERIVQLAEQEL